MEVLMKYSLISSAVSLVLYHHELLSSAGLFGYLAGILYLVTYRANATLIAIGCIATAIITVMYFNWDFSFTGYMTVGVAWSMTILAHTDNHPIVTSRRKTTASSNPQYPTRTQTRPHLPGRYGRFSIGVYFAALNFRK